MRSRPSFAQFEREVTGERIRDKIAASKQKGLRVGGPVPLGYAVKDKKLIPLEPEAAQVRAIFAGYLELGCLTALARDLRGRGAVTKVSRRRDGTQRGGIPFTTGPLAYLLKNRVYLGEIRHKGRYYRGEHEAIVAPELFDAVQTELAAKARRRGPARLTAASLLTGRIFDDRGNRMSPATARKGGACYRYYVSCALLQGRREAAGAVPRVPAVEIEALVLRALDDGEDPSARDADASLEQSPEDRIEAAVERVVVRAGSIEIHRSAGDPPRSTVVPWSPPPGRRRRAVLGSAELASIRPIRAETRARLVEGIARARAWLDDLVAGRVKDLRELAKLQGCSERSVRMTLNLAFLAPEIVRAAVQGTLPDGLGRSRWSEAPTDSAEQMSIATSASCP